MVFDHTRAFFECAPTGNIWLWKSVQFRCPKAEKTRRLCPVSTYAYDCIVSTDSSVSVLRRYGVMHSGDRGGNFLLTVKLWQRVGDVCFVAFAACTRVHNPKEERFPIF